MATLKVSLGSRSYPILIGNDAAQEGIKALPGLLRGRKVALVTNAKLNRLYGHRIVSALTGAGFGVTIVLLPDGEQYKTLKYISRIYNALIKAGFDRADTVIALGGGVVGDMAGFAAATYMRGIDFVQFPTTLLAQVDSSVGGKTGVDHPGGKNIVGAFYQPRLVACDLDTLSTLPRREYLCGLAEVIKYGVIRLPRFFSFLERNREALLRREPDTLSAVVRESCACKARVVESDEREAGERAILNFGHTFGHGIETALNFLTLKHGEAVAIGMVMAGELSLRLGLIDEKTVRRVEALIGAYGLPTRLPKGLSHERVLRGMEHDKKIVSGKWRFVVYDRIGNAFVQGGISREEAARAISARGRR